MEFDNATNPETVPALLREPYRWNKLLFISHLATKTEKAVQPWEDQLNQSLA
jgi:hypothetical protein